MAIYLLSLVISMVLSMKLFHFYGLNSGHNWYNPGHRNLHLFRSTQVREVPARRRYLRLERAMSTAPTENNVCLGKDALKPLKISEEHQLPMNPSKWSGFMYIIYIYMFILSLLPMGYSCGEVWINPPLVNQPVAKRHPSIPLIHGWIMKWSKLVFLSWLLSGKL